ncbi:MAG: OmpA family protein [Taibaiella sp.]|nr:OmpA family protein [Taibaiella sp.]
MQLQNIAEIMKAYPDLVLKMGGYTDNTGNPEDNKKLSAKRAQIAGNFIIQKSGVLPMRMESEGYGADHFICEENSTPECKAVNRRVDVSIRAK